MTNLQRTPALHPFATSARVLLCALSLCWLTACGGPGSPPAAPLPGDSDNSTVADEDNSHAASPPQAVLPAVPSTPAAVPAGLMAEVVLSNPTVQLTQVGTFADAVSPGIGAFVTPLTFMQMLGGFTGANDMRGVDLNGPLYIVALDIKRIVLVVTMSSEAELRSSLEASKVEIMVHQGFAAVGSVSALSAVGPYALSNLVTQPTTALPTLNLHIANIMNGPRSAMLKAEMSRQLRDAGAAPSVTETLLGALGSVGVLRTSLDASAATATVHMTADVLGGPLKTFLGKQRPADFSMMDRVGSGPWGMAAAGRIDLSVFAPLLVALGEAEANPILTQIAAQVPTLNGEMALGLNMPTKPSFVMAMDLEDPKGIAQVVNTLMSLASKKKDHDVGGMKGTIKLNSISTRAGSLHELRAKPKTKEQIAMYGKKNVSGFFGVAVNSLVATFGENAKKNAKTLSAASGKISGSGSKLAAAIALAKSAGESFILAMDPLSFKGDRAPKDVDPIVLGLGFGDAMIRARMVVPTAFVKEAAATIGF